MLLASALSNTQTSFIIGHELGHVLLGHLDSVAERFTDDTQQSEEWREMEFAADARGAELVNFTFHRDRDQLFGIGETFKVLIIANAAFFPVAMNTLDGVRNVPRQYRDVADIFQFGRWSLTRKVIVPSALPFILTGFRLALSRCWMIVVAAELFGSSSGLGHMMDWARQMFRIDIVMVGVIVTGVIGFGLDRMLRTIERRFSAWRPATS